MLRSTRRPLSHLSPLGAGGMGEVLLAEDTPLDRERLAGLYPLTLAARAHFEIALRQALEVPVRILQPTVLYWYGRALSGADVADRARGRAMAEAALTDFRALEMVLHANLAEQLLREGQ